MDNNTAMTDNKKKKQWSTFNVIKINIGWLESSDLFCAESARYVPHCTNLGPRILWVSQVEDCIVPVFYKRMQISKALISPYFVSRIFLLLYSIACLFQLCTSSKASVLPLSQSSGNR